jgi:hypothetical protein
MSGQESCVWGAALFHQRAVRYVCIASRRGVNLCSKIEEALVRSRTALLFKPTSSAGCLASTWTPVLQAALTEPF